jgi:cytochrome c556
MRRAAYAVIVLTFGLALAGCKSESEKQMSEVTAKQKDMVAVLKGVTDKESAKAADAKLRAIAKDLSAIFEKAKQTRSSQDEQKRIVEKYKPEQEQLMKDMQVEMQRVSAHPEWVMEMMGGLQEIGAAGMKAKMMAK